VAMLDEVAPTRGRAPTVVEAISTGKGEFEMELVTQRWAWTPSVFGILGSQATLRPCTSLLVAAKHPDDRPTTRRVIADVISRRRPFQYRSRVVRGDGQCRVVEATGRLVAAPDGAPRALVGTVSAISDWDIPVFEDSSTNPVSEGQLAVALLAHLEEAHVYAFQRFSTAVARSSNLILRDRTQVDDVVQSVFEALWRNPARFDPERSSLVAFLRLEARCRSIDLVRSESRHSERLRRCNVGTELLSSSDDDFFAIASRCELQRTLDHLPAAEREPIELAFFGDMTYKGVAVRLGLPEGTVKSRIRSGLMRLNELARAENLREHRGQPA
jgi:RNA polymerase sigma-70 factor (ECF subfamily)